MQLPLLRNGYLVTSVELILTATSSLQGLIDRPGITHEFCNRQAVEILRSDGFSSYADFLEQYLPELNLGVYWADQGWNNVHHYFDAGSGKGLWQFANAAESFKLYYHLALKNLHGQDLKKAAFLLGAAAHLVQDLCVPHHARVKLFSGHKQFEAWAQKRYTQFAVTTQGAYLEGRSSTNLLLNNAAVAAEFLPMVSVEGEEILYHKATEVLLPLAQRTTAGLFWEFANMAGKDIGLAKRITAA
jgi:phospholipase C